MVALLPCGGDSPVEERGDLLDGAARLVVPDRDIPAVLLGAGNIDDGIAEQGAGGGGDMAKPADVAIPVGYGCDPSVCVQLTASALTDWTGLPFRSRAGGEILVVGFAGG